MAYLSGGGNAFEKAINRGLASTRSPQLDTLVESIKKYIWHPSAATLRQVTFNWDSWRNRNPKEYRDRGAPLSRDFQDELTEEYRKQGIPVDADDAALPVPNVPEAPQVAINRWSTYLKRTGKLGMTAGSLGISGAQTATGTGLATMALTGTAAIGATGIGLAAAGGALALAQSVLAATSAWKTKKHLNALQVIYDKRDQEPFSIPNYCQMIPQGDMQLPKTREAHMQHDMIANLVLPYLINQKWWKTLRKGGTAVLIVGSSIETARAIGKKAWKFSRRTLGVERQNAASWMAAHLVTCNCLLVQAIVAELYSMGEMEWLKHQPYGEVVEFLEVKMKST